MPGLSERLKAALAERYIVERQLGKGGMATVFLARDRKHRRLVALKVLDPEVAAAIGEERFRREIETVARLAHPHILALHDSGVADGLLYYVTPYVEGESLRDRIEREGPLPTAEALRFAAEIADALGYAHRHGIVHRDIKPGNILLEEGHALLADFGIARTEPGRRVDTHCETDAGGPLTTAGIVVGTPTYMSPEQIAGTRDLDGRTDQYALGCVLFEMLAGTPPFPGPSSAGVMRGHLAEPPPRIGALRPGIEAPLERAILRALAKDPASRYQDVAAFGAELRLLERRHTEPESAPAGGRRALVPALVVVAALLALVVVLRGVVPWWIARTTAGTIRTVAVLPLANLAQDPGQEYFAEGMTGEITTELAKLGTLRVISPGSARAYRGTTKDFGQIGRELGAEGIVEGSVLRVGSRVRVSTGLVHAPTGREIWSRSFETEYGDIRALQRDVAHAVAGALRRRQGWRDVARPGRAGPLDPAAHEACLRGRHHWNERTAEGLRAALADFALAARRDSAYAPAWVGLADTYCLMPLYDTLGVDEAMPLARNAALRALALDSTLAEAWASLGHIEKSWTFDWHAAEGYYRKALALNPSYATAHHWYAVLLVWAGHVSEGLAEIEQASRLDPLSPIIQLTLARICYLQRDYPRAAREYQRTIDLDAARGSPWRGLSGVYYRQGRIREASAAWEMSLALLPESLRIAPAPPARTAGEYLERRLDTMRDLSRRGLVTTAELAAVLAERGARDEAFGLLRTARMDELVLGDLRTLPDYDSLRADPRWAPLEAEVLRRQSVVRGARSARGRT